MSKFLRFFDDPISRISDWFFHLEQDQMRSAIKSKYGQKLLEQTYWITGTKNENEGLSENPDERQVQRLTLSQLSVLMAHRVFSKRNIFIIPLTFIIIMGLSLACLTSQSYAHQYLYSAVLAVIGVMLFFGTTFFAPVFAWLFLPATAVRQDEIDEAEATLKRCVIRELPDGTPDDLADRKRVLTVDANGEAVAGQILASDIEFSALRSEWMKTKTILRFFGAAAVTPLLLSVNPLTLIPFYLVAVISLFKSSLMALKSEDDQQGQNSGNSSISFGLIILLPLVLVGLSLFDRITPNAAVIITAGMNLIALVANYMHISPLSVRSIMLHHAVTSSGTELLIDKAGKGYFLAQEAAKNRQIAAAIQDKSDFIQIGKSTGIFAERRDYSAPAEKGMPMGLTLRDISTHLFALGASGTGKTFGVLRPVAKAWADLNKGGMIVLDGKGVLPLEISEYCNGSDFLLISPEHTPAYNPLLGMSADSFADTLADICGGSDADPFWSNSGRLMVRMASNALQMTGRTLSFSGVYDFLVMPAEERNEALSGLPETSVIAKNVISYFTKELPAMDEKTRENVLQNVRSWLGNIINNAVLSEWCEASNNVTNVEEVFIGSRIGVLLPESLYGEGAKIISALVMRRIYDAAKKRGDRWNAQPGQTPVMMIADEIQNLLSSADIENAAISRSLGLYLVMASQNVDGLYKRLGKDGSVQMLGNFASLIALPPKTEDSNNFLSMRAGNIWKSTVSMYYGLPDSQADLNLFNNSGTDRQMQNVGLYRRSRTSRPRLAYSLALSGGTNLLGAQTRTLEDLVLSGDQQQERAPNLALDVTPLINADEIESLLAQPHTAIAVLNRGGVVRRDVIDLGV